MLFALLLLAPAAAEDAHSHLIALGEESLRCSACELVASKMDDAIDSKLLKSWGGIGREERVLKLRRAFAKRACAPIADMQIALLGEPGGRRFDDFNVLMKKGGGMSNLSMGPEQREMVQKLCNLFVKVETAALVELIEDALASSKKGKRRRLADLRMRDLVCQGMLRTCLKNDDVDGDGDHDDDDDEREL